CIGQVYSAFSSAENDARTGAAAARGACACPWPTWCLASGMCFSGFRALGWRQAARHGASGPRNAGGIPPSADRNGVVAGIKDGGGDFAGGAGSVHADKALAHVDVDLGGGVQTDDRTGDGTRAVTAGHVLDSEGTHGWFPW